MISAQDDSEEIVALELDNTVPNGAVAARYRGGRTASGMTPTEAEHALRVTGQIQIHKSLSQNIQPGSPEPGKLAPGFRAITYDGKMVDLGAFRGKKVWLIFYRYATCPLCNLHIHEVGLRYPALKQAGLEVIAVFESPVPKFFIPGGISQPIPIISDSEKVLYSLYQTKSSIAGVIRPSVVMGLVKAFMNGHKQGKVEGDLGQMPSHFLINENGWVHTARHGNTAVDHIPWADVEAFVKIKKP